MNEQSRTSPCLAGVDGDECVFLVPECRNLTISTQAILLSPIDDTTISNSFYC